MAVIEFVQLNMKKSYAASIELGRRVSNIEGSVVCMISEPYRYRGKVCSLPNGFKSISSQSEARAAILWRGGREICKVERLCNPDCAVGIVKINNSNTILVSAYLDIKKPADPAWLQLVIDYSNKKKYPAFSCN